MAQYDTGLGWEAEFTWLVQTGGLNFVDLVQIGGTVVPQAQTVADIWANGLTVHLRRTDTSIIWSKYGAEYPQTVSAFRLASNDNMAYFCSPIQGATLYYTNSPDSQTAPSFQLNTLDQTTGWYYAGSNFGNRYIVSPDIPVYNSITEAIADIITSSSNQPIYKLNPGWAVAGVIKWKDTVTTAWTPFLISTEEDAVDLSLDGQDPYYGQYKDMYLYQGRYFYMSVIQHLTGEPSESVVNTLDVSSVLMTASDIFNGVAGPAYANIQVTVAPDPWQQNTDPSEEEGGIGDDPEDDPVDEETLPIPAVVGLGFSTIYVPTQADLYSLASYMWGGNLDLDNFLKLFANPMDSILGLSAVPLVLSGTYEPIYLGGQLLQGITMPKYTGRTAVKVDMGTATITERWGAYLDYDPYTELAVYVPFVGIKNIKADDVMGKTIRLMYDIDILSGACIAYIRPEGGSPLYEWSGQCAMQIPITGANWDNIFNSAIHTVATLGGALFAPASAPVLGGAVASAASQAIAAKPRIERSGAMNGVTGFLGQLRPYIIRTIPEAYIPNEQNKFIGYPSYVSVTLGSLTGYNEIASIHLENIPATGDELSELESILKGGAIF